MSYPNTICTACYQCPGYEPTFVDGIEACNKCACEFIVHTNINNNMLQNSNIMPSQQNVIPPFHDPMSPAHAFIPDNFPSPPFHPMQNLTNTMPKVTQASSSSKKEQSSNNNKSKDKTAPANKTSSHMKPVVEHVKCVYSTNANMNDCKKQFACKQ